MKNLIAVILISLSALFGGYSQYDIVDDYSWQDSDGGAPVQRTLYGMIDEGKVLLLTWGYNG